MESFDMNINILTDNNNNIILTDFNNDSGYIYHYGDTAETKVLKDDIDSIIFDKPFAFEFGIGSDDMTIYNSEILNEDTFIKNEYNNIGLIKKDELTIAIEFCDQKSKDDFFKRINSL